MKVLISIIVTAVVVSALFLLTLRYRPDWLIKLTYDDKGFPLIKMEGDKFIINNVTYIYQNGAWVVFVDPIDPPADQELRAILEYPDYSDRVMVQGYRVGFGIVCFSVVPGVLCAPYIKRKVAGLWVGYQLITPQVGNTCCYKKI